MWPVRKNANMTAKAGMNASMQVDRPRVDPRAFGHDRDRRVVLHRLELGHDRPHGLCLDGPHDLRGRILQQAQPPEERPRALEQLALDGDRRGGVVGEAHHDVGDRPLGGVDDDVERRSARRHRCRR